MSEDELSDSSVDEKENRGNVERLLKRIKELEDEKLKMKSLLKENEDKNSTETTDSPNDVDPNTNTSDSSNSSPSDSTLAKIIDEDIDKEIELGSSSQNTVLLDGTINLNDLYEEHEQMKSTASVGVIVDALFPVVNNNHNQPTSRETPYKVGEQLSATGVEDIVDAVVPLVNNNRNQHISQETTNKEGEQLNTAGSEIIVDEVGPVVGIDRNRPVSREITYKKGDIPLSKQKHKTITFGGREYS
ncbi:uncharacterized protein LOC122512731 [Leptopilina heterotoma]|uniref:uncharacterized protein LOC122512731 n=1 Tax=Leptopilina heterotoma TaxID=63436 RepID=UPI001CA86785|nr:uncharacterized protein LOC122512731 [Leptopilina heterotoma]